MELKNFIKETISSIIEATSELQADYEQKGTLINPPVSNTERDLYEEGSGQHTYRRVETIQFDVAVTAANETTGSGKAALKIFSVDLGAGGEHSRGHEEASRVKFNIPVTLPVSTAEAENREIQKNETAEKRAARAQRQTSTKSTWGRR